MLVYLVLIMSFYVLLKSPMIFYYLNLINLTTIKLYVYI